MISLTFIGLRRLLKPFFKQFFLLSFFALVANFALALNIVATVDVDQKGSDFHYYKILVSNTDSVTRSDVTVTTNVPAGLRFYYTYSRPVASGCGTSYCDGADIPSWDLGDLAPGDSQMIIVPAQRSGATDGQSFTFDASVTYAGLGSPLTDSVTTQYDTTTPIELSIDAVKQTVDAGSDVQYQVSYGNIGNASLTATEVAADIPAGTTLVSASDGGTQVGSQVVWDIGILGVGSGSKRFFTVSIPDGAEDGEIYLSNAQFTGSGSLDVTSTESIVVNSAAGLTLDVTLASDISSGSGDYLYYRYVLSNRSSVDLADVVLNTMVADNTRFYYTYSLPTASNCGTSYCDPGEWSSHEYDSLPAGESRVVIVPLSRVNAVNGELLTSHAVASDSTGNYRLGSRTSINHSSTSTLELSLSAEKQVAATGEEITYELNFGNISGSAYQNLVLEFDMPAGATLVSTTGGGSESDGVVSWDLGTLNTGTGNKRMLTLTLADTLEDGDVVVTTSRLHTGGQRLIQSAESVVVRNDVGMTLSVTLASDISSSGGDFLYYRYVLANHSSVDLADVSLRTMVAHHTRFYYTYSLPTASGCGTSYCDPGVDWSEHSYSLLPAGESRVVIVPVDRVGAVDGEVLTSRAVAYDATDSFRLGAQSSVNYDSSPALELSLSAEKQVVDTAEEITYELNFGNISGSAYQNLVLEFDLPPGASLVSASDGGSESDGVVSWSLGTLNTGSGNKRLVTVELADTLADGEVVVTDARLHTGGPRLIQSSESVVVRNDVGLSLTVTLASDTSSASGDFLYYRYVLANHSSVDMADVSLRTMVAHHTRFYYTYSLPTAGGCGSSYCDPGVDWSEHSYGLLPAGESRVVIVPVDRNSAVDGEVLTSRAVAYDATDSFRLGAQTSANYDSTASLELSLAADTQVAATGAEVLYELSFGNISNSAYQNLVLEYDLPAGATLVNASNGGTLSGGVVSWDLGTLNTGAANKRYVRVSLPGGAADGDVIVAHSRLHSGAARLIQASESVVVRNDVDLGLDVSLVNDQTYDDSGYILYRYVLTNRGSVDLADVTLRTMVAHHTSFYYTYALPVAGGCGSSYCNSGVEWSLHSIDQLRAGESRVVTIPVSKESSAVDGEVLTSQAVAYDSGGAYWLGSKSTALYADDPTPQVAMTARRFVLADNATQEVDIWAGNPQSSVVSNAYYVLNIPDGYSVQTVSNNGVAYTVAGSPIVVWPLGNIPAGQWLHESVTLVSDAGLGAAEVLVLRGSLHRGADPTNALARSQLPTVIGAEVIDLDTAETNTAGAREWDLLAENISSPEVADTTLYFWVPSYTYALESGTGAVCSGSTCNPDEWGYWDIGNFDAGAAEAFNLPLTDSNPPNGLLLVGQAQLNWSSTPRKPISLQRVWGAGSEYQVDQNHDSDGDGAPDWWEIANGFDFLDGTDGALDADNDDLSNTGEYFAGTLPYVADTDADGITDGAEVAVGLNPLSDADAGLDLDSDGLSNLTEHRLGTLLDDEDSDNDGWTDYQEALLGSDPLLDSDYYIPNAAFISVHKLWDINGDGVEEVGQFGKRTNNNKPQLIITDPTTGSTVTSYTWEDDWYNPQLVRVSDRNGDGVEELALFGLAKADLRPQLVIKNGANAAQVLNTFSWPASWTGVQFVELDDSTSDGVSELAIFGFDYVTWQPKLVVRDGSDPEVARPTTSWPSIWNNVQFVQLPDMNSDGVDEVAIFGQRTGSGRNQLVIKDGTDPDVQIEIYNWGNNWDDPQVVSLADLNNDLSNEIALMGVRKDDGRAQMIVKSGSNRSQGVRNYGWPEELTNPIYMSVPDRDNDGLAELGMVGVRSDDGRTQIIVKKGSSQQTLEVVGWNTTWLDGVVHILADLSTDALQDYALLGNHFNAGYAQLVVINSATGQNLRTFSWPTMDATKATLIQLADMNGDNIPEVGLYSAESGSGVLQIKNGANQAQILSTVNWPAAWY
ncbi:hypothetical protein G8764_09925 [Pseudomaricurvus alcaniphilus]|uniref:DUF11 domain-containing protein n=1 Tax=Pseudomaricurvus alcaniphilus TaxID=1166482 RepID=UPI001409AF53|nr:DUF11 domain-containing protein [Pseudomaricurvus alcaniphilus]NHN37610.1 hypothetical protein [Pseudomaricurvus alcaniphilus]